MADNVASTLARGKADLERATTAQKVADVLRARVLNGELAPGVKLSEEAIGGALGVSRNTLREAFRLLTHDRLLVHEHSRGVFVRVPTKDDVHDIYAARRIIECGALSRWDEASDEAKQAVKEAVEFGQQGARTDNWADVGTGNIRFHQAITRLAGSERLNEDADRLYAEVRLAFQMTRETRQFYERYLQWNVKIVELLNKNKTQEAVSTLDEYFRIAEQDVVTHLSAS
ncbi:GntR family transcriptional regulator [Lentzea tibetensis]|uniref:GntR family transcriptional regulator n=1 Tax=Lentzea tibetensis TaxID=2591470 RepID=A0A563EYZ6_9PSEU|nr:GntR family transcriptional regulator [Lentzea tibetensis]TWP52945.1 GntR family transcriptional regulator [Lentzea tibetensis]